MLDMEIAPASDALWSTIVELFAAGGTVANERTLP